MLKLIMIDVKKAIYDIRILIIAIIVCVMPIGGFLFSVPFSQENITTDRTNDYQLLRERIEDEIKLQEDESVIREYGKQYDLVTQMAENAKAGLSKTELLLQNEMELRKIAGKKQVYYEDVFSKYLGLGSSEEIENRICYREYLVKNDLPLIAKTKNEYSLVLIIYKYTPMVIPLIIITICMALALIVIQEEAAGKSKVLLAHPYQRWQVILSKYFVAWTIACVIFFLFMTILIILIYTPNLAVPFIEYPIRIDFPTVNSYRIGSLNFVSAGDFLKIYFIFSPINILFYLSLFAFVSIRFSSFSCVLFLFLGFAAFIVLSVTRVFPLVNLFPFYYTNTFLFLTGDPKVQNASLVLGMLLIGSVAAGFLGMQVFRKKDYF